MDTKRKNRTGVWINMRKYQSAYIEEVSCGIEEIELERVEPFCGYYEKYGMEYVLSQFKESESETKRWDLIPAEQYGNLLKRFMDDPATARIPDNVVTGWLGIIFKNICETIAITKLFWRGRDFPFETVRKVFPDAPPKDDEYAMMAYLDELGFYDWAVVEKTGPAWSDVGFMFIYRILKTYNERMSPEEKLVLINRCLDVTHIRGSMAGYFVEGGKRTCDAISKG